jgi:hypothetical protein
MSVSIVLPISRTDFLRPVFNCLRDLEKPQDTELLIITDGDTNLQKAVDKRLDSLSDFKLIKILNFGEQPAETINERRYRISQIHNFAKAYVNPESEYVMLIEDDGVYSPDTLTKFLHQFKSVDNLGFIEGVQMGRHNAPYVGGWLADDPKNPEVITSVLPDGGAIDAGGLYCCLTYADLYRSHHFEPFDQVGTNGLSCDVNFGLSITNKGYRCMIDWDIVVDHIGDKGSVNIGNTKPVRVRFSKVNNKWEAECLLS